MSHRHYPVKETEIPEISPRLLSISLSRDEKDWPSVLHTHPFTEIFFVLNGEGNFLFHRDVQSIKTGDLIIIPPYLEHTEQSIPGMPLQYYVLGIDGIAFQEKGRGSSAQIFCNFDDHALIGDLFAQIYYEAKTDGYGAELICRHLLEILVLRILRSSRQLKPVSINAARMTKECARIKEYLDPNYADHITLDTLTKLTHMNKYYMAHSFAKYTGLSPIQYLNRRRLEAACQLLRDTDLSISDIAGSTGFSSQSYFTQAFRKCHGITPMKYRQTHEAKQLRSHTR